ncbi:MAG TPA: glycosyltransferase family 1 protein [Solirubrobacteraceae bacterium]|jgi:glycosyltransferase involved in cell wall biosynthesis|nr:glycosyltransferase family 1 protein [Solirubrobacteraceae bacterium]
MRIGLVARFLGLPIGLGTYAVNLLEALDRRDDEHEYFIYTPTWNEVPPLGPRFRIRRSYVPRGSRAAHTLWDQTLPALAAAREPIDLVHYLHPAGPPFSPRCPVVVNLLDAIRWVVPGYRLPYPYDWLERRAVRRADMILTLSESARTDIERVLGVPREKIRVTYLGSPPLDPGPSSSKQPYFLFVGGTEKRKNLAAALEAFKSIEGYELRVVGQNSSSPVHDERREQSGVRWLGYIGEQELVELYRHASALVFPSRYEGFGLPVLEAMARRTPVIAADASSIPEVARGAAILVDPDDVEALREAMRRVVEEPGLGARMIERGVEVVSSFSWDETARATVAAYEELCAPARGSG